MGLAFLKKKLKQPLQAQVATGPLDDLVVLEKMYKRNFKLHIFVSLCIIFFNNACLEHFHFKSCLNTFFLITYMSECSSLDNYFSISKIDIPF